MLFDQGTPVPLREFLKQHEVSTAFEHGWSKLKNGDLLDAAEKEGFAAIVTTDLNLKYQQNLKVRPLAIVVLSTTSWPAFNAPCRKWFVRWMRPLPVPTWRSKFREEDR